MKLLPILFAIVFFGSINSVDAQRTIVFGSVYLPKSEQAVLHGSLSWYQNLTGPHSIGLKTMFSTDALGAHEDILKTFMGNIDLVHRWTFLKNKGRNKLLLDAGISMSGVRKKIPDYYYFGYCGTGLTEERMLEIEREIQRKNQDVILRTGLASSVNWEWTISRHIGIGIGAIFNMYYSPEDGWLFLPLPNLSASYSF